MTFNSAVFLAFFAVFYPIYLLAPSWPAKKAWLLFGGLVFYGWFNPYYLGLVFLSTTIDYLCVGVMAREERPSIRKAALVASITSNLTILATFKYFDFFSTTVAAGLSRLGLSVSPPLLGLVLPIGISFYSFEAISYAVDSYRSRSTIARSYFDLLLFITFFPHLVAGPIVRARDFLPQLETPRRIKGDDVVQGLTWIVGGFFFKIGVADNLSASVKLVFSAPADASLTEAWLAGLFFAVQIFGDFAGYTMIARGLAKLLGFVLCENFNYPYLARGFSDFWQRWHISLSSWLRDYLYISLGGNRRGKLATQRNLLLTMLLGGLWHGAAWTYVVWGGLHGIYLVVEHALRGKARKTGKAAAPAPVLVDLAQILITFLLVIVGWVFFRATSLQGAFTLLKTMFGLSGRGVTLPAKWMLKNVVWLVPVGVYYVDGYLRERGFRWSTPPVTRAVGLGALAFITLLCREVSDAFIYFQF